MSDRYRAVPDSQTAHCCFSAAVVRPALTDDSPDECIWDRVLVVCECFTFEQAELIAAALNATDPGPTAPEVSPPPAKATPEPLRTDFPATIDVPPRTPRRFSHE